MRKVVLLLVPFCLATVLLAMAGDTVIEEIVARVNNAIITRGEFQRAKVQTAEELKQQAQQGQTQVTPEAQATAEKDVLRDLIDHQLLLQKAQELGMNADTEMIKQLDELRKKMKLDSMEDLEKAAAAQGVSFEDYKQKMREDILYRDVIQREVGAKIQITAEEEKKFYDEHKSELDRPEAVQLSEILIPTLPKTAKDAAGNEQQVEPTPEDIAAAQTKANEVIAELKKGAKFEDLAMKYSGGSTAAQGGDIGYYERGKLAKQLEDVAFALKVGAWSDPIQTKQGFLILKATDHSAAGIPPFKDVEQQVQNAIYMEKLPAALRTYLTKLREDSFIDIKAGYVDTGASPNESKPVIAAATEPAPDKAARQGLKKKKRFLLF